MPIIKRYHLVFEYPQMGFLFFCLCKYFVFCIVFQPSDEVFSLFSHLIEIVVFAKTFVECRNRPFFQHPGADQASKLRANGAKYIAQVAPNFQKLFREIFWLILYSRTKRNRSRKT